MDVPKTISINISIRAVLFDVDIEGSICETNENTAGDIRFILISRTGKKITENMHCLNILINKKRIKF